MGALFKTIGLKLGGTAIGAGFSYAKMIGVIVVLAILGGIGFGVYEFVQTFNELQTTVAVQKEQIDNLTSLLDEEQKKQKQLGESGKVDTSEVATNLTDHNKTDKVVFTNTKKRDDKIATIKDKFKPLPPTVDNKEKERNEISVVNINSLWDTFCGLEHLSKDNEDCNKVETPTETPVIEPEPIKENQNV